MAQDVSTSAGPQGLVDRNAQPNTLPSGTVSGSGTTGGTTTGSQSSGGTQASSGASAQQNMTPAALAALQALITQLSDHPAVSDAAATLQLQASGLRPPSQATNKLTGRADAGSVQTYTDEQGRPIYSAAEFQAAQTRYNQAKADIVSKGGTVAGGTPQTQAAQAMHDSLVQSLSTEHANNIAAVALANTKNAEQQAAIFKAYGDSVSKAAETYDANKTIVENANATNRTQNDAAFQTYLSNTVTADADHQRAILQNAQDRAIAQANLTRSQGLQTQSLAANRAISEAYSKEAAFNDASSLTAGFARKLSEQLMPSILRATEAAGTSGSATTALLAQDAAARTAESAATVGVGIAANYGQIQQGIAGVNANLVNNSPTLQATAPVAGIQQIAPVNPLNPGLIQPQQQIQAPNAQGVLTANDSTTQALTQLTTQGANPALDALLTSLGISKGAVSNTQQSSNQTTSSGQSTSGTQAGASTDNKTQTGGSPAVSSGQAATAPRQQTVSPQSVSSGSMIIQPGKSSSSPDDIWAGYQFPAFDSGQNGGL